MDIIMDIAHRLEFYRHHVSTNRTASIVKCENTSYSAASVKEASLDY